MAKRLTVNREPNNLSGYFIIAVNLLFISIAVNAYSDQNITPDAEKTTTSFLNSFDGYSTIRYRAQNLSGNTSDQDAFQYLNLSLGDYEEDNVTWYFFGSFREDIDNSSNTVTKTKLRRLIFPGTPKESDPVISNSPFFSTDDSQSDGFIARPHELFANVREFAIFKDIRIGRQYMREVENLHFDGLRMELPEYMGIRPVIFAGAPVHLFESSSSGDSLAGAYIELQPANGSRLRLTYTHINDNNKDTGGNEDNLIAVNLRHNITKRWNIFADFSMLGGRARDVEVRSSHLLVDAGMNINVSLYKQLGTLDEHGIDLDDFNIITGDLLPFTEYSANIHKRLWKNFAIGTGVNIRNMNSKADEGSFNHEYTHYYATLSFHDLPFRGTSVSVTANVYNTDDNDTRSVGLDVRQKVGQKLTISAGAHHSLFQFDRFFRAIRDPLSPFTDAVANPLFRPGLTDYIERDNVRTFFLDTMYKITGGIELKLDYEFERFDGESYHTFESALTFKF